MVAMFLVVFGVVGGFALALFCRAWLRGCEARRKAETAREEASDE